MILFLFASVFFYFLQMQCRFSKAFCDLNYIKEKQHDFIKHIYIYIYIYVYFLFKNCMVL